VKLKEDQVSSDSAKALAGTTFEAVSEASHNVFTGLIEETEDRNGDMMLMGWQGGFSIGRIYNSPVQKIIKNLKADVGILKDRGLENINSILLPWGGGYHAQLGLEVGLRIARNLDAKLTILRLVKPGTVKENERAELEKIIKPLAGSFDFLEILIQESESVAEGIDSVLKTGAYDLTIIGASHEFGISNVLFGTITDIVADNAPCSVLMVRRYLSEDWKLKAGESLKRMKEQLGMSSSPESGNI
jgi:nucleotide-binding universal stress UspA family protein